MKIIIFGSNGFLGKITKELLIDNGHNVIDIPRIDISSYSNFKNLPIDVDVVINCAAKIPGTTPLEYEDMEKVNTAGASNVARWVIDNKISHLVHCSTLSIVTRPDNKYAISKRLGEEAVIKIAPNSSILRFSAIYGPGMKWLGVIPNFITDAKTGKKLQISRGASADFIYIDDAAKAVVAAAEKSVKGIINVASGKETSIETLARIILYFTNRSIDDFNIDSPVVDITRMKKELGIEPEMSIQDGIVKTIYFK